MNMLVENPEWKNIITPFILSGGKSRRMGTNKSFVNLAGRPLIEIVMGKVTDIFIRKPIIITNSPEEYEYLGYEMVSDIVKNKGPLGGIHAALTHSPTPYIFILACDMPFVEPWFIRYMAEKLAEEDILIPHNGENVEPLHAIYSKRCLAAIETHLHDDHRCVQSFFQDVSITYINQQEMAKLKLPDSYFLNVNTLEDLVQAEANCQNLTLSTRTGIMKPIV